jgi:hypothetical protein
MQMALLQAVQEKAGSVGAAWPPAYDAHNRRVKGFFPGLVRTDRDARRVFREVRDAEAGAQFSTRTTFRAFVRSGLVEELRQDRGRGDLFRLEAHFSAGNVLPRYQLAYFGHNHQIRMPHPTELRNEMDSVREVRRLERAGRDSASQRVQGAGYRTERLNGNGRDELHRLLALYQEAYQEYTFTLTEQAVSGMLENGNIVIVGRDRQAEVVSALIAEHVELVLAHGKTVHLYELSDYATFRAHRGKGLITLMQMEAISAIRALPHGREAIIYAEDRAAWAAVNKSSQRAGMDYFGTLPQHCVLVSDRDFNEQGRYENLNVWVHIPNPQTP